MQTPIVPMLPEPLWHLLLAFAAVTLPTAAIFFLIHFLERRKGKQAK